MATTTPNFGWPVPTSTDLVKDGATAIEALGDSIDASLLDLKGGTTGQVLSKTTNTDMDFTWVTTDDANAIQNSIVDAKGDLIAATANDTPARLAVGTNGQVLTADSTAATGIKWATAATGGGLTLLSTTTITSATTTISSISGSYNYLLIYITNLGTTNANPNLAITFNGASTFQGINSTAYDATAAAQFALNNSALTNASHPYSGAVGGQYQSNVITLNNYSNTTQYKPITYNETFYNSSGQQVSSFYTGKLKTTSAITSMTVTWGGTTGITGTVLIYGGN
jgi:hypothetical protein